MMRLAKDDIARRAESLQARLNSPKLKLELHDGESLIGGGAAPSSALPTRLLALTHSDLSADELAAHLRTSDPPIVARVDEGRVLLDLRTVFPDQDAILLSALERISA
jgi:L-seryl-tRNA(Ser) seleniumtransferase